MARASAIARSTALLPYSARDIVEVSCLLWPVVPMLTIAYSPPTADAAALAFVSPGSRRYVHRQRRQ